MAEERYVLKFAGCALASAIIILLLAAPAWSAQGFQTSGTAFAGVLLNLGVLLLAIVASAIAFIFQEA